MAKWSRTHLPMQETQETCVQFLVWEDSLEKEMATHSRIFTWEILWREEPVRLQSMSHKESDMTELLDTHAHASLSNKLLCMQ